MNFVLGSTTNLNKLIPKRSWHTTLKFSGTNYFFRCLFLDRIFLSVTTISYHKYNISFENDFFKYTYLNPQTI